MCIPQPNGHRATPARELHCGHFAFTRALVLGPDERAGGIATCCWKGSTPEQDYLSRRAANLLHLDDPARIALMGNLPSLVQTGGP